MDDPTSENSFESYIIRHFTLLEHEMKRMKGEDLFELKLFYATLTFQSV